MKDIKYEKEKSKKCGFPLGVEGSQAPTGRESIPMPGRDGVQPSIPKTKFSAILLRHSRPIISRPYISPYGMSLYLSRSHSGKRSKKPVARGTKREICLLVEYQTNISISIRLTSSLR